MRNRKFYTVMLLSGILLGSSITTIGVVSTKPSDKKINKNRVTWSGVRYNLPDNIVIPNCDDFLNIRSSASSSSDIVGRMELNTSAEILGEESGDWIKVKSGEVEGWVFKPYTISGSDIKKYINKHKDLFSLRGTYKKPTGIYSSKLGVKGKLSYKTYVVLKKGDKVYKTKVLSDRRTDAFKKKRKHLVKIKNTEDWVRMRITPESNGVTRALAQKGVSYSLLGSKNGYYKIKTEYGNLWIDKKYGKHIKKKIGKTNISNVKFKNNGYYQIVHKGKDLTSVIIDGNKYWLGTDDITFKDLLTEDTTEDYGVEGDSVEVNSVNSGIAKIEYNDINDLVSDKNSYAYVNAKDLTYEVEFTVAESMNEDTESDYISPDTKEPFFGDMPIGNSSHTYEYDYDNSSTDLRNDIVNFALQYLGNPYVYGGTSLENGCDCSAFCMRVLEHFDINIGRCTATQVAEDKGRKISDDEIQPGDLIYYSRDGVHPYHVVMYLGGNKCVNASCRSYGICISDIRKDRVLCIKNYID